MANILSGGKGIPSFEEWKRNGGGNPASVSKQTSGNENPSKILSSTSKKLLSGGNGIPSFGEWSKIRHSDASPVLDTKKTIFDTSESRYADSVYIPRWNQEDIDGGTLRKAEQLRVASDKNLEKSGYTTSEELALLKKAGEIYSNGDHTAGSKLEIATQKQIRERKKNQRDTASQLREEAYSTEQAGYKNVGESLAASDPHFLSKASEGYEKPSGTTVLSDNSIVGLNRDSATIEKENPILAQRTRDIEETGSSNIGATLDEQLQNIRNGKHAKVGAINGMGGVNVTDMTEDELKTYAYWYGRDKKAAKKYLESISADVNKRTAEREMQETSEKTREKRDSGLLGVASAVGEQLILDTYSSPLSYVSVLGATLKQQMRLTDKGYDPYSGLNRGMLNASAMQEGLTGDLPTFGKFLADTGLSTAQFLSTIPLGSAGLVVMASGAAGKTANEVKRSGGTTSQALELGTIAGLAEYASEKIPFENIANAFKGVEKKGLAKLIEGGITKITSTSLGKSLASIAGSTVEEGLEELITEYVNNIANDTIMGDNSEMKKYARELVESGMDYEEACRTAFKQYYVINPLVAFAGGALSGAVMTGTGEAWSKRGKIGQAATNTVGKAIDAQKSGTQAEETVRAENEATILPKDEQFDKNGNFILRTAEQENRIRQANATSDNIERSGKLAGASDTQISIAKSFSKTFGRNIVFDSSDARVNGKFENGTIYLNPKGTDNVSTILAHELTHSLEGTDEYNSFSEMLKRTVTDKGESWQQLKEEVRSEYEPRYKNMGQTFTDADCESETLARVAQSMFDSDSDIETFVKQNRNAATRFWHKLTQSAKRLAEDIKARRQYDRNTLDTEAREAQFALRRVEDLRDRFAKALLKTKGNFGEGETNSKFSIKYDKNNTPYVEIDKDVLEGVPRNQWVKEIKKRIPNISSVRVGNNEININAKTKNELLYSKYTKRISQTDKDQYHDKLLSITQLDEIVTATRDYINEEINHSRKDNINQFARGVVNFKSGENEYQAEVVCGITTSGRSVLYDIIGLKPIKISTKNTASVDSGLTRQSQNTDTAVSSDEAKRFAEYTESVRTPQRASSDANIISHSGENVNTLEKNNSDKAKYSLAGSALARAKQMETEGESPFAIKEATGWYRDNEGNWKKEWHKSDDMFSSSSESVKEITTSSSDEALNKLNNKTTSNNALDETTKAAKEYFGTTKDWNKTGYLLTDGTQLDFSGKHEGYDSGMRSVDHREIENVYTNGTERVDAINDFLAKGNIRIMPEGNSINLVVEPNAKQETALRRYINSVRGEVIIDIDNSNGNTVKSIEYDSGTSAAKILSDIHDYFENGSRSQSDIAMFHNMGDQYSVVNEQYGTKPLNTAEAINRQKAIDMLKVGKDPQYVYQLTGWFRDRYGNLMVDHGAEVYSYGSNESESSLRLKATNEQLKYENETLVKARKSNEVSAEAMRIAYNQGVADSKELLRKALHSGVDMKANPKYVNTVANEIMGDDIKNSDKAKIKKRISDVYEKMADLQSAGNDITKNPEIMDEFDSIATEIQDSRFYVDEGNADLQSKLSKELKVPMYLSPKARGDLSEGYAKTKKELGSKMKLVSREAGTPVDVRYMELNGIFGNGLFPSDIQNEAAEFEQMIQVANTVLAKDFAKKSVYDFSGWEDAYKSDHSEIMTKLAAGYKNLEQTPKTWADKFVSDINKSFEQKERENNAKMDQILTEMTADIERVQADAQTALDEYRAELDSAMGNAMQAAENLDKQQWENELLSQELQKYKIKEQKMQAEKKAKEQRRHDRGGDISKDKVDVAMGDGTFGSKMLKLYDMQKELSNEYAKYSKVDIEALSDKTKGEVKSLAEKLANLNSYINKIHQVEKKVRRENALKLIATGDIMAWKDKKGWMYDINTMVRNIEDISKGDALGKQIIDEYIKPVHHNEAEKQRFMNDMRKRVSELGLDLTVKNGNKLSESALVQLLAESRSNIEMLENENGNAVNEDGIPIREGKTLEDWQDIQNTIIAENPNMDTDKIENAIETFRMIYNELFDKMNEIRVTNGYAPIDYHAGYFPHYNNQSGSDSILSSFASKLGISQDNDVLPTSINGLTHTFRPGIKYMSNAKQRSVYGVGEMYNGFTLLAGAVEGFDRYIETAADVIYHTNDIQNLRALSDAIRYSTTNDSKKEQVDAIYADSKLSPEEQQSRIGELFENAQNYRLSNFVVNLEDWTNIIAGKKSLRDRQFEQFLGRSMYQTAKKIEQRIAANQVALNPGSWLTNFVPLTQAGAVISQKQLLTSMWDTVKNGKQSDGFAERSDFLSNRFGSDKLVQSKADKVSKLLGKPMDMIDGFTAETIVRARYAQNLAKNLSESDAMAEADMFAYKLMANRAKGDMPTIFHVSNPVWKLFTQYQLEVDNQLMFMLKDLPKEAKARDPKYKKELAKMLAKMCFGAFMYNEVYELFVGRRCALDPLNILNEFAGDILGYNAPGLSELKDVVIGEKEWSDIVKAEQTDVLTAAADLSTNILSELPFIGGVMGGGRIPVSSALPDFSNLQNALTGDKATSKRVETIAKELAKPAAYIIPPFGGGQIKKAVEGTAAYIQGGSYTRDNDGKKKLQYPIENKSVGDTVLNLSRAVLFGKTANKYGREWVDDEFGSLSTKATTAYEALVDDGIDQGDAFNQIKEMKSKESRVDKVAYLLNDISGSSETKRTVYEQMILGTDESINNASEKLDLLEDNNINFDYYLKAYESYLSGEGDAKKTSVVNEINNLKLSSSQKDTLYCCFYRESGLADTPWHNSGIKKVMANEIALPEIIMPEITMPDITMPEISMPKLS